MKGTSLRVKVLEFIAFSMKIKLNTVDDADSRWACKGKAGTSSLP
jgi:hypothetical protein